MAVLPPAQAERKTGTNVGISELVPRAGLNALGSAPFSSRVRTPFSCPNIAAAERTVRYLNP
jgi:hypothetical protein